MEPNAPAPPIAIVVNGEPAEVMAGSTILDVARSCGLRDDERGVAIARGGVVVGHETLLLLTAQARLQALPVHPLSPSCLTRTNFSTARPI